MYIYIYLLWEGGQLCLSPSGILKTRSPGIHTPVSRRKSTSFCFDRTREVDRTEADDGA